MAKHSSSDQSRLNGNIFIVGGCLSHTPMRPLQLLQRSSVLEALTLKNSILRGPIIHRLQMHSLVCCNVLFVTHDRQYKILQDVIHLTIRALQKIVHNYQTGDDYYKKLNNIMFHSAILVIIMSGMSATDDNMIS